jgi:DNA-binding GntR family transcriptional regulator
MPRQAVSHKDPLETIVLDRSSPIPLYFQLAQHYENEIHTGSLDSGDRIENEVKIAELLGLSRPTVRQALRYLVDKGLVVRRRGQGTIVTKEKVNRSVKLTSLFDDLAGSGRRPTTRVLHNEVVRASDLVKDALGLGADEPFVIYLERLRYGDDEPISLMHNYLPTSLVTLSNEMLEEHGLYELLRASGIYPFRATQRISAKNASAAEARVLNETKGSALLTMERTTYDEHDRPLEFARHVYRASRYALLTTVGLDDPTRDSTAVTLIDSSY